MDASAPSPRVGGNAAQRIPFAAGVEATSTGLGGSDTARSDEVSLLQPGVSGAPDRRQRPRITSADEVLSAVSELSNSDRVRNEFVEAGRARARTFTWERCASRLLAAMSAV